MRRSLFTYLILSLLLLTACEPPQEEKIEYPTQPAGFQELLTLYNSQALYLYSRFSPETTLYFQGSQVTLPANGLVVHDCRYLAPDVVTADPETGMWYINTYQCGIKYQPELSNEQATVVYAYVDLYTLHLQISNGTRLDFLFDESLIPRSFRMPMVKITHQGNEIYHDEYVTGHITIEDPDKAYSPTALFQGEMKIKGRGHSTWGMPKKPYKFKLNEKASVLGLAKEKSWCLLANYADKSLVRNLVAMELSRICELSWTPQGVPVEVSLNGVYMGVYNLFDDKEISPNRVNIGPEDFYIEIEQDADEALHFVSREGVPIQIKEPETATSADLERIRQYISDFEAALMGPDFRDPDLGYAAWIDVDSFINNFIVRELAKDVDGNMRKSTFLTWVKGQKMELYHVWDFDLAFGNADYFPGGQNGPTGWWVKNRNSNSVLNKGWYYQMFRDPAFIARVKERWNEVYPRLARIPLYIDKVVTQMGDAPKRNFQKWDILGTYVWPNVVVTGSYEGEVDYLKNFYNQRLSWLNKEINAL